MTTLVDLAMADRFATGSTPRSDAYKAGFRARLRKQYALGVTSIVEQLPYRAGTAQFDAFFAGVDDAAIWLQGSTGRARA